MARYVGHNDSIARRASMTQFGRTGIMLDTINGSLDNLPSSITRRSGSVFYTGRSAFERRSPLYVLGLNPGGDPDLQRDETIAADIAQFRSQPANWSAYRDESWRGKAPGSHGMQPRVLHMMRRLGLQPHEVPASNVVFVRSATEAELNFEKAALLKACWPVHEAVIDALQCRTVLCFGGTAGRWVRSILRADTPFGRFRETNARGWLNEAHLNSEGLAVLTLTHPGRADWRNPDADPFPLIENVLAR